MLNKAPRGAFFVKLVCWLSGVLLLLSWLLPLHVPPWVSWHNELVGAAAPLVACGLALFLVRTPPAMKGIALPTVAMPLILLSAVALFQVAIGSIAYWGSFWVIAFYAATGVMAAAAGYAARAADARFADEYLPALPNGEAALTVLANLLLAGGLIQLFLVFSQTLLLWEDSDWIARTVYLTRGSGNLAQPNQAALLFLMSMASAVHVYQLGRVRAQTALVVLLLLCVGLSVTESRSGVIGFCALAIWWAYKGAGAARWQSLAWASGSVVTLLGMFAAWPHLIAAYWFLGEPAGANLSTSGRIEIWRQLLDAALLRPWLGWGVLQVAQAQNAVADSYPSVMASTFSHNVLLDVALWAGIPAGCAFFVMACIWVVRRLRMIQLPAGWYCMALALPVAIQSMTEFPYAYIYFLVPVFFALGALDASIGLKPGLCLGYRRAKALFLVVLAGYSWAAVEYVRIEDDFRVARFEALRLGQVPDAYERPTIILLTQLGALLDGTRIQPKPSMPREEIDMLRNVALLYPWAPAKFRYLTALALNGELDAARRQLTIVRVMHGQAAYASAQERLAEMSEAYPVLKGLAAP
jgi:hypothetical protein